MESVVTFLQDVVPQVNVFCLEFCVQNWRFGDYVCCNLKSMLDDV